MPHSLKNKIKSLCYKGEITEKERDRIIQALEQQPCEDCISILNRIMEYTYGMLTTEKFGLQHLIKSMMDDLPSVTPQQTCEEENPNCTECRHYDKEKHYCPRFCRVIENTMAEITSEQERWIPCSEMLPEREGWYLTSLGDKTYGGADVDMYCKGWVKYGTHVLAWMPLPEGYKEEEGE